MKPGYLEALPGTLKQFSDFLGDRKWFAGDKVCNSLMASCQSFLKLNPSGFDMKYALMELI